MKYEYSKELAAVVKEFLEDNKWHYSFREDTGLFEFSVTTRSRIRKVDYVIDVHEDEIIVYGFCPFAADPDDDQMMAQMSEFLCRANYGMKNGNFEFDFRDSEIRFKSYIDCEGVIPSTNVIKNSVACTSAMYKRYGQGIIDIILAGCTAKAAIAKCEKSQEKELRSLMSEVLGESAEDSNVEMLLSRLVANLGIAEETDDDLEEGIDIVSDSEEVD